MNAQGKEFLFHTMRETFDKNEKKLLNISEKFMLLRLENSLPLLVFSFFQQRIDHIDTHRFPFDIVHGKIERKSKA